MSRHIERNNIIRGIVLVEFRRYVAIMAVKDK